MNKTFMIIDDDVSIRKMLGLLIKKHELGRVICELDSGEYAVDEILFYSPDIILVDLLLPGVDGIEIVRKAKQMGAKSKIVMISQVEEDELISRAYESGILFYIGKPINSIEAINVIKGVCSNIDLENSLALIKSAVQGINESTAVHKTSTLADDITNIFTEIGIIGVSGSNDLRNIIMKISEFKRRSPSAVYQLQDIYEEIVLEEFGSANLAADKKALEQRIRRAIQKCLTNIAEMGSEDYSNSIFLEYSALLFDFKQVRQEMRHIEDSQEESGKITTKKFIEGILTKFV